MPAKKTQHQLVAENYFKAKNKEMKLNALLEKAKQDTIEAYNIYKEARRIRREARARAASPIAGHFRATIKIPKRL